MFSQKLGFAQYTRYTVLLETAAAMIWVQQ